MILLIYHSLQKLYLMANWMWAHAVGNSHTEPTCRATCAGLLLAGPPSLDSARRLLAKGLLKEAVATLRQIIAADPRSADAHSLLGTAMAPEGMRSESIEQLLAQITD
jgi:hypothetical protein